MTRKLRRHQTPALFNLAKKLDASPALRSQVLAVLPPVQPQAPAPVDPTLQPE